MTDQSKPERPSKKNLSLPWTLRKHKGSAACYSDIVNASGYPLACVHDDYATAIVDAVNGQAPQEATECRYCDEVMKERDDHHEWADTLAHDIERLVGVEIGEHSNLNSPWENAHDAAEYELDKRARQPVEPAPVEATGLQCEKDGVCALVSRNDDEWHCTACNGDFVRKQPVEPGEGRKGPEVAEWPELPSKTNPDILVDERCMDLAKHFLAGGAEILGEPQDCVANRSSLARDIQQAVEDWFLEASLTKGGAP